MSQWREDFYSYTDSLSESFLQFFFEAILYDAVDCYNYVMIGMMHIADAFSMLLTEPFKGVEHFGFFVHESPVIFSECWRVYNDTTYLLSFNNDTNALKKITKKVALNVFWNNADLIAEVLDTSNGLA